MGTHAHFVYSIYYTRGRRKRKPLFCGSEVKFAWAKKEPGIPARLRRLRKGHFWKVTPVTATLTAATFSPLVLSTALNTFSCTALATSVTT